MPPLTPYMGPLWIHDSEVKHVTRITRQKRILLELADQMPQTILSCIHCVPFISELLPLKWKGYQEHKRYTYLIKLTSKNEVWESIDTKQRNIISNAQKALSVLESDDIKLFNHLNKKTYDRQDMSVPYSNRHIENLDSIISSRGHRKILIAQDEQGNVHGSIYLFLDHNTIYLIGIGSDPNFRNQGSIPLLIWSAIVGAIGRQKVFDFEGSSIPSIESFFRSFGGELTSYSRLIRTANTPISILLKLMRKYE